VTSLHLPLVVPSAASAGDLAVVPLSWPWLAVAPQGTLVPEGLASEASESSMLQMLEVSVRPV
jgi:hypothetical protein